MTTNLIIKRGDFYGNGEYLFMMEPTDFRAGDANVIATGVYIKKQRRIIADDGICYRVWPDWSLTVVSLSNI